MHAVEIIDALGVLARAAGFGRAPGVAVLDLHRLRTHPIVAHQGGWDEFLYVAVPIVAVFALLRVANTRAKAIEKKRSGDSGTESGASRSD